MALVERAQLMHAFRASFPTTEPPMKIQEPGNDDGVKCGELLGRAFAFAKAKLSNRPEAIAEQGWLDPLG